MASKDDKPKKLLLTEEGYTGCKDLILELGAVVSEMPIEAFLNTIEEVRGRMHELKDMAQRARATDNLNMFKKVAEGLLPFQKVVHEVAKDLDDKDRKNKVKLVEEPN